MSEYVKTTVYFHKSTVEKVKNIVLYENSKNALWKADREKDNEFQDFVTGCVNLYIEQIENVSKLSGYKQDGHSKLKNNIKRLLIEKGMSQKHLSEMTGISNANISLVVNNVNQPSLENFLRICAALGNPPMEKILYREEIKEI